MIRVDESQVGLAKGDDDVDFIGLGILKEFLHNGVRFPSYITGIEMTPFLKPGAARGREKKRVGGVYRCPCLRNFEPIMGGFHGHHRIPIDEIFTADDSKVITVPASRMADVIKAV